jgi:fatty acid synthase
MSELSHNNSLMGQIALTDLLWRVGVEPDGIVGHSTGEMCCGYADGCLTLTQTMLLAYYRGRAIIDNGISGAMAAVGLTWDETIKRVPNGRVVSNL